MTFVIQLHPVRHGAVCVFPGHGMCMVGSTVDFKLAVTVTIDTSQPWMAGVRAARAVHLRLKPTGKIDHVSLLIRLAVPGVFTHRRA